MRRFFEIVAQHFLAAARSDRLVAVKKALLAFILFYANFPAQAMPIRAIPISIRQPTAHAQRVRELIFNETLRWLSPEKKFFALEITSSVVDSAAQNGLDPLLVLAMIIQESSVRPNIRGSHGEIGLMQLKLKTARWLARRLHRTPPTERELFRPKVNIEFGAAYLAYLRETVGPERFIQAYNLGPTAIRRFITSDYIDRISRHYRQLLKALEVTDDSSFASLEPDGANLEFRNNEDPTLTPIAERTRKGSFIP